MFVQGAAGIERSQGGLGLGLSLVHTLVALHGGSVTAHSDGRGRGSEFVVRLPASTAVPVGRSVEPVQPSWPAARRWRVLLVDDNRDAAALIGNLLRRAGHDVQIAHDPSIALEMIVPFRPQVAILDIGLPVMDGYALADEMRRVLGDATPVLIAVTGYGQERDRQKSEQSGFRAHFVKPVDSETMLALLEQLTPAAG